MKPVGIFQHTRLGHPGAILGILESNADEAGLAVAGHCLGSQLLARAFGATVRTNRLKEIGWSCIEACEVPQAPEWLGVPSGTPIQTFQWHSDTFEPPHGAVRLATGLFCSNQAFVHKNRHLAIQSHLEMTPQLIRDSVETNAEQIIAEQAALNPAVDTLDGMLADLPERTERMHRVLAHAYGRWLMGVRRPATRALPM